MLPTEIPSARILAFNYKSNWHKDGTSISVWALGEELMREISVDREKVRNNTSAERSCRLGFSDDNATSRTRKQDRDRSCSSDTVLVG